MTAGHNAPHSVDWASSVYFIAEAGVNHNGDPDKALALVDVAAEAGADAVKFQTFMASALVTANAPKATYQVRNDGSATTQAEMLAALELAPDVWEAIRDRCRQKGIAFLSTPFDFASADFLESLGVTAFKVSSGDLTYLAFLAYLARKGLPMIISTGMANLAETEEAVRAIEENGNPPLAILHCVSDYPCDPADANLRVLPVLEKAFGRPVGWSDHTLGTATGIASVALGARLIEKHFTLDRTLPGPDHAASLEPEELKRFIADIRITEKALGSGIKRPTAAELDTAAVARRSIVLMEDVHAGERLTDRNCAIRRPGSGMPPKMLDFVLGRRVSSDLPAGTVLNLSHLD
ncbi:N-acetylneuraminate synthase [Brucella sp. IR073]|uniref:N-acetylneuraminate synthase n=1 Tax=unclassified Brucella TaxID=2632610 RepID=UPI003B97FEBD